MAAPLPGSVHAQDVPRPPGPTTSVVIGIPGAPITALVGEPLLVTVQARGSRALTGLELWATDRLVATLPMAGPAGTSSSAWHWTPDRAGDVALVARAADAGGTTVLSNALHLRVVDPGTRRRTTRATRSTEAAVEPPAAGLGLRLRGCHVRLRPGPTGDADGLSFHHLSPTGVAFARVATVPAQGVVESFDLPVGPGLHVFSSSTFDDRSERMGPPVGVVVPARCGRPGWDGAARLDQGRLRVPADIERGYLYLRVDDQPAIRVPSDPHGFVAATDGVLDFGAVLPRLDGETLTFEAWGWAGGRLERVGDGRLDMGAARTELARDDPAGGVSLAGPGLGGLALGDIVGLGSTTSLDLVVQPGGGEFLPVYAKSGGLVFPTQPYGQPINRRLRWTTSLAGVSSVVWQVLPYPPGKGADLAPPFAIDLWSEAVTDGATSGDFVIDLSIYLEHPVAVAQAGTELGGGDKVILGDPVLPVGGPAVTPAPGTVSQALLGGAAPAIAGTSLTTPVGFAGDFYVRIVPMIGATPMPPSNAVRLYLDEPAEPLKIDVPECDTCGSNPGALGLSWSFTLPTPADPTYAACAVVTGFGPDYVKPPPTWPWTYKIGKVLCPDPPDDGWSIMDVFEAAVSFVTEVWDFVSSSYDWVKKQVVSAVLAAVPCQAIADKSVCESVADIALGAVAVGFGVPPSIPDFDSAVQALKGDMVDFIVEQAAEQFPAVALACGVASAGSAVSSDIKDCEALASAAVDEVVEQVVAARSKAAGTATGKYWPGVLFAPDPRGQWQPPTLTITATRTDDPVQPKVCQVAGGMTSTVHGWKWPALVAGKTVSATGDVKGSPFQAAAVLLPQLSPGESVTRTLWLDDWKPWFESKDSYEYWYYAQGLANPNRAWVLLQQGAELTFTVSSNCAPTSSVGPVVLPTSASGQ